MGPKERGRAPCKGPHGDVLLDVLWNVLHAWGPIGMCSEQGAPGACAAASGGRVEGETNGDGEHVGVGESRGGRDGCKWEHRGAAAEGTAQLRPRMS
eukprot:1054444-Pelagomonas_calceolata.AAC.5